MKKNRTPLPVSEIEEHFADQLSFLERSMHAFDAGSENEHRRIASTLRVLLHKTRTSHALVDQVNLSNLTLPSFAAPINPENLLAEHSLATVECQINSDGTASVNYRPMLDRFYSDPRRLSISEWKDEKVLRDNNHRHFARWELVLAVANQDGGSHVDPEIDTDYYELSRNNSVGWFHGRGSDMHGLHGIEKAYIRHIAFEAHSSLSLAWAKILGNYGCACGSGRKARYCCLKS